MRASSEKPSRKQEQVIAALLQSESIAGAAAGCGIAEATLYRWLKEPTFQEAYRHARRAIVQQAIVQVQAATSTAVTTLVAVMNDPGAGPSSKVAAARTILETAIKAVELEDLEARIAALEAQSQEVPR